MDQRADENRSYGLPQSCRLKKQRLIRPLFDRSRADVGTLARGVIRLLYRVVPRSEASASVPVQVGFASGRVGGAVRRNRIKRILREVYRVNQHDVVRRFADMPFVLTIMVVYRGKAAVPDHAIRHDLPEALRKLTERLSETSIERGTAPIGVRYRANREHP